MKLEDMVNLGKIDYGANQVAQEAEQRGYVMNVAQALARAEGKENEPGLQQIIGEFETRQPMEQRQYLNAALQGNQSALIDAVSSNIPVAIKGLSHVGVLGEYLLGTPKPGKFGGVSDDWAKAYASAHSAYRILRDKDALPGKAVEFIAEQVEKLSKKISAGMLNAFKLFYDNNNEAAVDALRRDASEKVGKFQSVLNVKDGQAYLTEYFGSLNDGEKANESYRLGQAVYRNAQIVEAEKKAKKK